MAHRHCRNSHSTQVRRKHVGRVTAVAGSALYTYRLLHERGRFQYIVRKQPFTPQLVRDTSEQRSRKQLETKHEHSSQHDYDIQGEYNQVSEGQ